MEKVFLVILLWVHAVAYCYSQTFSTDDYIRFYQNELSNHKNSRCSMYPSCSRYGRIVFNDYPFVEALLLTTDRLMRCSHDARFYDVTYKNGYRSLIDLPAGNTIPSLIHHRYVNPHTDILKPTTGNQQNKLFINKLINDEQYSLALLEIERHIFGGSDDSFFFRQKLLCFRGLKEYEKGIFEYEVSFPEAIKKELTVQYQVALLYYCTGNYEKVLAIGSQMIDSRELDGLLHDKVYALCGITETKIGSYDNAIHYFSLIDEQPKTQNSQIVNELMTQKYRSPAVAKALSIIPGAGYLYTNHTGSALTAFAINALLGYATYTSIKKSNYGAAGVFGFFSLSFYLGNINGAGRSANRFNQRIIEQKVRKLESLNHIFY